MSDVKSVIESGRAVLGIEFGSTRIKAVLIGEDHAPIATGAHDWENMLVDGIWTYSLDMIWEGISDCYSHFGHGEIPSQVRLQQSLLRCLALIFRRGGA